MLLKDTINLDLGHEDEMLGRLIEIGANESNIDQVASEYTNYHITECGRMSRPIREKLNAAGWDVEAMVEQGNGLDMLLEPAMLYLYNYYTLLDRLNRYLEDSEDGGVNKVYDNIVDLFHARKLPMDDGQFWAIIYHDDNIGYDDIEDWQSFVEWFFPEDCRGYYDNNLVEVNEKVLEYFK